MQYSSNSILNLISHIHSQSQDYLLKELSKNGLENLATSHGNILFCLSNSQSLTLGELSDKINRDKSTTTALVKKLEKAGYVQITKDFQDSRKKQINLTSEGKKLTQATANLSSGLLDKCWQGFSKQDQDQLVSLLTKLSENLN